MFAKHDLKGAAIDITGGWDATWREKHGCMPA